MNKLIVLALVVTLSLQAAESMCTFSTAYNAADATDSIKSDYVEIFENKGSVPDMCVYRKNTETGYDIQVCLYTIPGVYENRTIATWIAAGVVKSNTDGTAPIGTGMMTNAEIALLLVNGDGTAGNHESAILYGKLFTPTDGTSSGEAVLIAASGDNGISGVLTIDNVVDGSIALTVSVIQRDSEKLNPTSDGEHMMIAAAGGVPNTSAASTVNTLELCVSYTVIRYHVDYRWSKASSTFLAFGVAALSVIVFFI